MAATAGCLRRQWPCLVSVAYELCAAVCMPRSRYHNRHEKYMETNMAAIANVESGLYRIPLETTLTDSMHGAMTAFEVITARITDTDGAEGVGYTFTCGTNGAGIHATIVHD